jgi:hypothetical protein
MAMRANENVENACHFFSQQQQRLQPDVIGYLTIAELGRWRKTKGKDWEKEKKSLD